ncbi:MAG TPA: MFS transporter [Candidatus Acidoferrum sp.]|nr:MFS transporter [Candidatus Acidoferrum sp.]
MSYKQNAKWLTWLAPFQTLSISPAYLAPFFLQHGMDISQIFLLQSIFTGALLLWEVPSGYIADRIGRARAIKISVPLMGLILILYGLSDQFWQFTCWEVGLALAVGMASGADTALLLDSLQADSAGERYTKLQQRINAAGFWASVIGVPVGFLLVRFVNVNTTIVADGLLAIIGLAFAWRLREAPKNITTMTRQSMWCPLGRLISNPEVRWLTLLASVLNTVTYITFWLSALYYKNLGISIVWFGTIFAVRSFCKAWLSHRIEYKLPAWTSRWFRPFAGIQRAWRACFGQQRFTGYYLACYVVLAGLVCFGMASGWLWLIWVVLGHDLIQALHAQPLTQALNKHIDNQHRATMNSAVNLAKRLATATASPLVGLLVGAAGLSVGLIVTGLVASSLASLALLRLHQLKTFRKE